MTRRAGRAPALVDGMDPGSEDLILVEGFHREGLTAGGADNGAPGPRPKYSPGYHGAFLPDPDGHNVAAVRHAPRSS